MTLNRRLRRLRNTALPSDLLTAITRPGGSPLPGRIQRLDPLTQPLRFPFTQRISTRSHGQALAASATASSNDRSTAGCAHAFAKPVFVSAFAIAGLKSSFQRSRLSSIIVKILEPTNLTAIHKTVNQRGRARHHTHWLTLRPYYLHGVKIPVPKALTALLVFANIEPPLPSFTRTPNS